jgi:hypothetical protein
MKNFFKLRYPHIHKTFLSPLAGTNARLRTPIWG